MDFVKSISLEESFSFSFRNVIGSYSVEAFSSDDEKEETFFEIDLDSHGADGFEFKISFSSHPGSDFSVIQSPGYDLRPEDQTLVVESFEFPTMGSTSSGVPSTVKISPVTESPKTGDELVGDGNRQQQLLASRRSIPASYKMTAALNGGGTMKFLIKFRSGKFFTTLMSLLNKLPSYNVLLPRQIFRGRRSKLINQETFRKHPRISNPFQKWFALINATYQLDDSMDDDPITNGEGKKAPVTAAIETSRTKLRGFEYYYGRKSRSNQKLLGGNKSSASNQKLLSVGSGDSVLIRPGKASGVDERESSVGAAIAHCKRSFAGYVDR